MDEPMISPGPKICMNCGNPEIVKDVPNALCGECRERFIKFPVPLWVRFFGGTIGALVIFSLFTLPANLSTGIAFEKGIQAEKEKKYVSAQHYFEAVVKKVPADVEARAHLLITSFYNNDLATLAKTADKLGGKSLDDDDLLNQVQIIMTKASDYFPSDSFMVLQQKYSAVSDSIPDKVFIDFIKSNDKEIFARVVYTSVLYDQKLYVKADSMLKNILELDSENSNALGMMSSVKRLEDQPGESLRYCDKLLSINHESIYALSSKARTCLKMKRNGEGLKLALQSTQLDSSDLYGKATLALAYHFNNQTKERDRIITGAIGTKDSAAMNYFQFVLDVISNKDHL